MADKDQPVRTARRKLGPYTIHDVAAMAGVASITVSRYFNSPEKVSPARRALIEQAVHQTGYVPSQVAGGLASARGRVVCAVIPSIANSVFSETVQGMSDVLRRSGFQLLLASSNYSREEEESAILAFAGWHPTAMILTGPSHTERIESVLAAATFPVVETWDVRPGRRFHQVGFSHESVGYDQAMLLIEQGATRIRFVKTGIQEDFRGQQRAVGYARAANEHKLHVDIAMAGTVDPFEAGAQAMAKLATQPRGERPQAVIFANDNMAAGAILHAPHCAMHLPQDCAIVGFGDFPLAARLTPSLTTVQPGRYEIGSVAASMVIDLVKDDHAGRGAGKPRCHLVSTAFVLRDSSRVFSAAVGRAIRP